MHVAEAFALQPVQSTAQLRHMVAHDMWTKLAIWACGVALQTELLWQVEGDGHPQEILLARPADQGRAVLWPHVGRVPPPPPANPAPQPPPIKAPPPTPL